jgi:glycosyltransferase involved in cell wall biosynthesis
MISIIIPSYNSENTVERCLRSLQRQSYRGDYEIVLVDSSRDRTPEIVSESFPEVKMIHLEKKTDPGTARNIGIKEAKGDIIALIDSDCVAGYDWLEKIETAHRAPRGAIGGVVKFGNQKDDLVAWAGYIAEFREFLPEGPKREVVHIPSCNMSYKREIFRKYGLFQGEYYPQEDLVFNYNLCKSGKRILMDPAIEVFHIHRSGLKEFLNHQKKIGTVTSKVLKVIQSEGSFIARNPGLAPVLVPFLPVVKFARTVFIFLRLQPKAITTRPLVLGIFALGLLFWVVGFARGIYDTSYSK